MTTRKRFLELIASSAAAGFNTRLFGDIVNGVAGSDMVATVNYHCGGSL